MADIQSYPLLRHLRGAPTTYVRHVRKGRVAHEGIAESFWFRPLSAVLSEVPVDDREVPILFHARTSDYQDVAVQVTVTYHIAEPARAAARIDFGIDPRTGRWRSRPLEQLGSLLTELAQQGALELLARTPLAEAVVESPPLLRERIDAGLTSNERLAEIGVVVKDVRVGQIRPEPDVEKALGTPAREIVQQEADRATYERRAVAVDNERAIAENELSNQIQLATQEEKLVVQRGQNERRRAEDAATAGRIGAAGRADATRLVGEAEADVENARLIPYRELEPAILLGLALKELAANLPEIERLTIAPDVLGDALAQVAGKR
jgi:regulator of protease activity HflC (stomatin/prohibitin superfamily)